MMPGKPSGYGPSSVIMAQPTMENPPVYPGPPPAGPQQYGQQMPMPMPMPMPMHDIPMTGPPAPYAAGPPAPYGAGSFGPQPAGGWPQPNTTSPRGLDYLIPLDKIFVDQKVELWEVVTDVHFENRYAVVDASGQPLYAIQESSDCCERMCCGSRRSFTASAYDRNGLEAFRIERPFTFFGDEAYVYSGSEKLGYIRRKIISCTPQFTIYDASHNKVLRISGPFCFCGCEHEFVVTSMGGHEVGEIKKKFSGFGRELFTAADKFGVTFPVDLDVKVKALLVGATLLVDFAYFERQADY